MELSELRTNEDVADYLRQLILALEAREKTPKQVNAGVAAAKALAVELNRPRGWGSRPSPKPSGQAEPASRSRQKKR